MKRTFIVKNRQKRKYVRKQTHQSSLVFSKLFAGGLPLLIVAIALVASIILNYNLWQQPFTISVEIKMPFSFSDIVSALTSLPNVFVQPLEFVQNLISLILLGIQQLFIGAWQGFISIFSLLDPRPAFDALQYGSNAFLQTIGTIFRLTTDGILRAFSLLLMSITTVFMTLLQAITIFVDAIILVATFLWQGILYVIDLIWRGLLSVIMFIWVGITSIFMAIGSFVAMIGRAIENILLIPITAALAIGEQISPYTSYLGEMMERGFESMLYTLSIFDRLGK